MSPQSSHSLLPPPESIAHLISTARAVLDSDRDAARACLVRAAVLLRTRTLHEGCAPEVVRGGLAPHQARRVLAYINANLGRRVLAAELAALVSLSPSHFFRAFRDTFGEAPMLYIARQRMHRAQELMLRTTQPLAQIALECGLCDQAHFTRMFRRVVGISPRMWRRQFGDVAADERTASFAVDAPRGDAAERELAAA